MSREHLTGEEPTQEIPNFSEQLRLMAIEEAVPEGAISDRGFELAAALLERVRQTHGDPTKDTYKHYHNDTHGLNFIRYFWALWKPLWEQLPDTFDQDGFELGMLVGAGHDIIYDKQAAKENPGQNERESAELTDSLMLDASYAISDARRVSDAIIKTTAENRDGFIVQTHMRKGSKDILGLCAGQADMNGPLIKGPSELLRIAHAIWMEENSETSDKSSPANSVRLSSFLIGQKPYFRNRVSALSDDLKYYVENAEKREIIISIYRDRFGSASLRTLEAADRLYNTPEKTKEMVDEALSFAGKVAHRGAGGFLAVAQHLTSRFGFDRDKKE